MHRHADKARRDRNSEEQRRQVLQGDLEEKGVPVQTLRETDLAEAAQNVQSTFRINKKLKEMVDRRTLVQTRIKELAIYAVFLAVYTYATVQPLSSEGAVA